MSTQLSSNWLPSVDAHILAEDEIPLLGDTPNFSWETFAQSLEKTFQKKVSFDVKEWVWRDSHNILDGIGQNPKVLQVALTPLEGTLYWVMSDVDVKKLISLNLETDVESIPEKIQEGFYAYIAAAALKILEGNPLLTNVAPRLLKEKALPQDLSLSLDISFNGIHGRLYLSKELRRAWARNHEKEGLYKRIASPVPLTLSAWMGNLHLSLKEWKEVALGDFLLLDSSAFDPQKNAGSILISYKRTLLFHGDLNQNKIKITEHRPKSEEHLSMPKDPKELPPEEDASFFLGEDEEFFLEDEELSKVLKEELQEEKKAEEHAEVHAPVAVQKQEKCEKSLKPEDIPLHIKLEIAHISITAKELLELRPGNEISLEKEIDNRVNLVVGGRCIGKGELIRFGETLGVRILEL